MKKRYSQNSIIIFSIYLVISICLLNTDVSGKAFAGPELKIICSVTDLNGGQLLPNDVLEYSFNVTNVGDDTATLIVFNNTIPSNTNYVSGSLVIDSVSKSDSSGVINDEAEYSSASRQVTMRLGTLATNLLGGLLAPNASTVVSFRIKVNSTLAAGDAITNQASATYGGLLLIDTRTSLSDSNETIPGQQANTIFVNSSPPNIQLTQSVSASNGLISGSNLTYTSVFTNSGGSRAQDFYIIERISDNTIYKLNSIVSSLNTTGLTVITQFSNSTNATFTYTPVSGGGNAPAGYDGNVKFIRLIFIGSLNNTAPHNSGSISFISQIK